MLPLPAMPPDWADAIAAILWREIGRVVVLGPTDAGKSTFCRLLLHAAAERGRDATLIDADPGQKTVGPPAAVTRSWARAPETLDGLAFVGATDPVTGFNGILDGLARLLPASDGLLVVNTSGLLVGAGRRLKSAKIERTAPDLLVTIGDDPALEAVLADHGGTPSLRLARPPSARRKSSARRRAARRDGFRTHFAGATAFELAPAAVASAGGSAGLSERLLVAVADAAGHDLALGLVEQVDPARGVARILSPGPPHLVAALVPGLIRIDEAWDAQPVRPNWSAPP